MDNKNQKNCQVVLQDRYTTGSYTCSCLQNEWVSSWECPFIIS